MTSGVLSTLAALILGVLTVFGFAPFGAFAVPVLTLAGLFFLWQNAPSPRHAAIQGFAFGVGLFGVGVSWVYIALSTFGEMAEILAAIGTAGFCAYLALFPALAGWMCARFPPPESGALLGMAPAT